MECNIHMFPKREQMPVNSLMAQGLTSLAVWDVTAGLTDAEVLSKRRHLLTQPHSLTFLNT